jgi:hypothetical protein
MLPEGLLRPGATVDLPGGAVEQMAQRLGAEGVARLRERTFVRCANPADEDFAFATDRTCIGRVYLCDGDDFQWCPRCERRIEAAGKQRLQCLVLEPNIPAIRERVAGMIGEFVGPVREHPPGVLRVESEAGEATIVLLDVCERRIGISLVDQGAIPVAADVGSGSYGLTRDRQPLSAVELLLSSPEPLVAAVRAALGGAPPVIIPSSKPTDVRRRPAACFPLPPGAGWRDVTIYYVDGATLGICVPGERPVPFIRGRPRHGERQGAHANQALHAAGASLLAPGAHGLEVGPRQ